MAVIVETEAFAGESVAAEEEEVPFESGAAAIFDTALRGEELAL